MVLYHHLVLRHQEKKEMYVHIYVYIQSGPELALQFKLFVLFCRKI